MKNSKSQNKILNFFIETLNGMAHGLFATLIVGTIIGTIGGLFAYGKGNGFCDFMFKLFSDSSEFSVSYCLKAITGLGIGVGVALSLKFTPLKVIVLGAVGEIAAFLSLSTSFCANPSKYSDLFSFKVGDPLTIYIVVILIALLMKWIFSKKTPVDILIIPLFGIILGTFLSLGVRYPLIYVTYGVQWIIGSATNVVPFLMGIIISIIMGMALTAPISSAAIAAMIFILPSNLSYYALLSNPEFSGLALASGAAIVGCSTQMIGFAIQSRKDNPIGIVFSIAIGTSMLQFKNILKKPIIWLPTIIASGILGPISTCLVKIVCSGSSAGMGTAGFVGQIGTFASMGNTWQTWVGIFIVEIIAPLILVYLIDLLFRKLNLIKDGDFKI